MDKKRAALNSVADLLTVVEVALGRARGRISGPIGPLPEFTTRIDHIQSEVHRLLYDVEQQQHALVRSETAS